MFVWFLPWMRFMNVSRRVRRGTFSDSNQCPMRSAQYVSESQILPGCFFVPDLLDHLEVSPRYAAPNRRNSTRPSEAVGSR